MIQTKILMSGMLISCNSYVTKQKGNACQEKIQYLKIQLKDN